MGTVNYRGSFMSFGTDKDAFDIIKVRDIWSCSICRNIINKKSYCFGRSYGKFCLDCGYIARKRYLIEVELNLNLMKKDFEEQKKMKEKYLQNNMVANL
jgi:hypothetical protein